MREEAHITLAISLQEWLTIQRALEQEKKRRVTARKSDRRTTLASRRHYLAGQRQFFREHIDPLLKYLGDALKRD
jgi:hypothetical protein